MISFQPTSLFFRIHPLSFLPYFFTRLLAISLSACVILLLFICFAMQLLYPSSPLFSSPVLILFSHSPPSPCNSFPFAVCSVAHIHSAPFLGIVLRVCTAFNATVYPTLAVLYSNTEYYYPCILVL